MENREPEQKKWSAAMINLGCKVNKYESDAMKDKLIAAGISIVEPEDVADIYIVNTCSVTNMAQKKSRQMLRRAKRWNPEAIIVACGCYVNAEHDALMKEEFIDIIVSNNRKKDIAEIILGYLEKRQKSDFYVDIHHTKEYEEMGSLEAAHLDHQRAYIKIQDGCNQFCSYCIIPYTRGRVRSRRPENILKEITKLAKAGVKEFVLTGIHISSYGLDFVNQNAEYDEIMNASETSEAECFDRIYNLGDLIKAVSDIPAVRRVRLGSLEPRIITEEFLDKISRTEKLCPHFHLSLQSACNETLKRMNRKYTIEEFEEKCNLLRRYFDRPAITTDVIVGFPGETDEEFEKTMENLLRIRLYEIHVFKYSVRAGTAAERLPDQVPEEVKNVRSEKLLLLTARQKEEYERSLAGYEDEVLIEEAVKGDGTDEGIEVFWKEGTKSDDGKGVGKGQLYYTGHTKRYIKVRLASTKEMINQIVRVEFKIPAGNENESVENKTQMF